MNFLTIVIVLIMISILVVVHEFGHYCAARRNGVRVEEFGIGYPPRIFGKKIGETLYSINLIPFGGFVKITGEDESEKEEGEKKEFDPNSFATKTPWQKSKILIAGVFMNLLLSFLLYYIFFFFTGFKSFYTPMIFDHTFKFGKEISYGTVVFDVESGSPADKAGIKPGEVILKIGENDIENVYDLRESLNGKAGEEVKVETVSISELSDGEKKEYVLVPDSHIPENPDEGNAIIGVYLGEAKAILYEKPLEKIFSGPMHTYNIMSYSISSLGKIIGVSFRTRDIEPVASSMTGPVGLVNILGMIIQEGGAERVLILINTVATISAGFAFTNILPIPALDGGRVVFRIYEGITKRKVNPDFESRVHNLGMMFLLLLITLITFKDIRSW